MIGGDSINKNYTVYHLHDDQGSVLDSCTKWEDYVDLAASLGMKAIASTNHGYNLNWTSKKMYAEKHGLKYIFGVECYLTASLYVDDEKVRDNYHTILLAKNARGAIEINEAMNRSYDSDHKYYKPRISFDEFFQLSDNVIKISACLASPLRKYVPGVEGYSDEVLDSLLRKYDYYEIQYHNCKEQIEFNQYLYRKSIEYNKPLIAATDTHNLNDYKAECRSILMLSKGIEFTGEDEFDLTFKSYDQLVAAFEEQNSLPRDVWMEAIENTNRMADSVIPFKLSTDTRYPISYGSHEKDAEKYITRTHRMLEEKIKAGIIPAHEVDAFRRDIEEELAVFKKVNMLGFMLSMSELICWCKSNGIPVGPGRGSVGGSRCAFVTDIIDLDPVKWHTVFSRFCNENRIETGDIDVDFPDEYRPQVYKHIFETFGSNHCAYVLALGTISAKGTIDDIGRALAKRWDREQHDKKEHNPYSLNDISRIKKEYDDNPDKCRADYPELFYYFDGLVDTVVSLSHHPAGIVISPIDIHKRYGTIIDKDGLVIMNLDMDAGHKVGVCKYDILGLDTVSVIDKTCKLAGIKYPHTWEIDFNDKNVWADIKRSPVGIFQFLKDFAFDSLKKYDVRSVEDVCAVTAAIRPSGASYRDRLLNHEWNKNPSAQIDKLLEDTMGYLVYQEQIIAFLQQICGMSGGEADSVRRAIGHKDEAAINAALPKILSGYCDNSDKPKDEAIKEANAFLKVIDDASAYSFGYNHALAYSILTYYCAYFRYHYPLEFITALLNSADTDEKIKSGTSLAALKGIRIMPIRFRHSLSEYTIDREDKAIYKGMSSIKYLNKSMGRELYKLRDKTYDSFIDLLDDISKKKICDSRQLDILIKLDFFNEFGNPNQLLKQVEYFNQFNGAKQLSKEETDAIVPHDIMQCMCVKETAKKYVDVDHAAIIRYLAQTTADITTPISCRLQYEVDHLGYIQLTIPTLADNYYCVLSVDGKYSNKMLTLYRLRDGVSVQMKVKKYSIERDPIVEKDIIKAEQISDEPKWGRTPDGEWYQKTETERVLKKYIHVRPKGG